MDINIKVSKGAVPYKDFFVKIGVMVQKYAWYLNSGDTVTMDGIKLERSYNTLDFTLEGETDES